MRILPLLIWLISLQTAVAAGGRLEFSLHKIDSGLPGPTILVVGGIQGDEPGGFHAASLLVTNYRITRGSVWVVPNLNFESIVRRSRGVNGDMNRKFAQVKPSDPDYNAVERIKSLIRNPQVDLVLNLHDGSGFYRTRRIDRMHNPQRWGQSIIIDQEQLETPKYAEIGELSRGAVAEINQFLLHREHRYRVKNTRTREGNEEMEKTLTYFAINNGKSAVGIEASKSLDTPKRVYYHLHALETFMNKLGIGFERDFELRPDPIQRVIDNNLQIAFYEKRMLLDLAEARKRIGYLPLKRDAHIEFTASNPLVAITGKGNGYRINYGNRQLTFLQPQFFDYDTSLESLRFTIDGEERQVDIGEIVEVRKHFTVSPLDGYRVNVIGWTRKGVRNEGGYQIERGSISKRFSVDRRGTLFRVEVYRQEKFTGMILVKFAGDSSGEEQAALPNGNRS